MMRREFLLLVFVVALVLFSLSGVSALGIEHGINGYVENAEDGTDANDAVVVFYIESRPEEMLNDIVGFNGNSGQDNWYAVDVKNFETSWDDGETLVIMIMKDELHGAITSVVLSDVVNEQQAPNVQLSQCEGAMCSVCGDAICNDLCNETIDTCPEDCGGAYCGDDVCDFDETYESCPTDCPAPLCGNGFCEFGEDQVNCPEDCGLGCNFDGICDFGESFDSCPDCVIEYCGNMVCEPEHDESEETCPSDCIPVVCGDGVCEVSGGETADNCPTDCKRARCGNKKCEIGETKSNCCQDCGCVSGKCVNNACVGCCLFDICGSFFRICWYIWAVIVLLGAAAIYKTIKKRQVMSKVPSPNQKKKKKIILE
jgi:hypothetical protein